MNNYRFIKYTLSIVLGMLCLFSCYEDKGNYDYTDINEIEIDGIEKKYTVSMGEPLTIRPEIHSTIPGKEDNYTYEWKCVYVQLKGSAYHNYTFSTKKDLEDVKIVFPAGVYDIYYRVIDNETGVAWSSKTFKLEILNEISSGFFIASNVDNKSRVDFISNINNDLLLKLDILSAVDSEFPEFGEPISVACYSDLNSPKMTSTLEEGRYAVTLLTTTGAYRFRPNDLTYNTLYNLSYIIVGNTPDDFVARRIYAGSAGGLLQDNKNNIYYYNPTNQIFWASGIYTNITQEGKYINIAPQIATFFENGVVMYDTDKKSFLSQQNSARFSTYYSNSSETEFDGLLFKFNETGKDIMYMFGRNGNPRIVYVLLKDPDTNEVFLGAFDFATGKQSKYSKIELSDLSNLKQFAMGHQSNNVPIDPFLYYRTDNNIYMYNINDGDKKLVYTAKPGHIITTMKFCQYGTWANHLIVCTYDPSKPSDSCGSLEVFKVTPAYGDLTIAVYNEKNMEWTGFGKIVDVDWKNK